jgi:LacI family transcriptional regulator
VVTFAGSSDEDPERERELVEAVLARRVDGLIIAPTAEDHSYLQRDVDAGIALVFVDRPPASIDADSVLSDNRGGAERAIAHLIAHGHRRIAFIGSPPVRYTAVERLAGYRAALSSAGLDEDPELVRHPEVAGEAYDIALELLAAPSPPTALFTSQNVITLEVLRALHRRKQQHEVALVGFDDIELAASIEPAISVIEQDARGIGRTAAELLFSRLDGYSGPARRVEVPTTLIARGTGEIAHP